MELSSNPAATMTLWLAMQRKQITLDGFARPLIESESQHYWSMLPRERQLRFLTYAPFSGQVIHDVKDLHDLKNDLSDHFSGKQIPVSEFYKGFCFVPQTLIFYQSMQDDFSNVFQFLKSSDIWEKQRLSP